MPALAIANLGPGMFALHAPRALRVSTLARIEYQTLDGRWTGYDSADSANTYRLLDACPETAGTIAACRLLAAGEAVVPVPWSGQSCSGQCDATCPAETFHAGIHRLVVLGCDDSNARHEGPPFQMPTTAPMVARWRAASDLEHATISRLDAGKPPDRVEPGSPDRIAGFSIVPGSSREIDTAVMADLLEWLRAPDGFNDKVVRRCSRGAMVGFVLKHKLPNGAGESSELALDFTCNSLILVREHAKSRALTSSFFDASRPQLLSIVRRALPGDRQLTHLR